MLIMSSFCVGSLSTSSGWETKSPEEALSLHFTYWFASRRNQGKVIGDVPSFYYLWATKSKDPEALSESVKREFESYLKELFPICKVDVGYNQVRGNNSTYNLVISANVIHENQGYDLARVVLVTGSKYEILNQ